MINVFTAHDVYTNLLNCIGLDNCVCIWNWFGGVAGKK